MIKMITSSLPTFKTVELEPGFNVVQADRTKVSTKKDTRNGLGKSTLVDIIHFCLGGRLTSASSRLAHPKLKGSSFSLTLVLDKQEFIVTRRTDEPSFVTLTGQVDKLPLPERTQPTVARLDIPEWTRFLGQYWFGLPVDSGRKYAPTFRSSISYFLRSGKDAYTDPFRHFRLQSTWDIQVNNAFLLGLAWEDASDWQLLRDRARAIDGLKVAAEEGFLGNVWGSRGQLEADRIRLEDSVRKTEADLKEFRILSQYRELESQANVLAAQLEALSNEASVESELLDMYKESIRSEQRVSAVSIAEVYQAALVELGESVKKNLADVEDFHRSVVENRKKFLQEEIDTLESAKVRRLREIEVINVEQSRILSLLNTHGALDQYTKLQQAHSVEWSRLRDVENRLSLVKRVEQERAGLKIDQATLEQRATNSYEKRSSQREEAIGLFDANARVLYNAPGRLLIDIGPSGFRLGAEIERKGSTGISNMEIFCYDLMLAEVWARKRPGSIVLVHDSNIFADVDDRQVAAALELAAAKSAVAGFQYLCNLNSDKIPVNELTPGFDLGQFTRLTLTDLSDEGGLLGMRLPSTFDTSAAALTLNLFPS